MSEAVFSLIFTPIFGAGSALLGAYLSSRYHLRQAELARQSEERRHHKELVFRAALDNWMQSRELGNQMASHTGRTVKLMPLDVFLVHMAAISQIVCDPTVTPDNLKERLEEARKMMEIAESMARRIT